MEGFSGRMFRFNLTCEIFKIKGIHGIFKIEKKLKIE